MFEMLSEYMAALWAVLADFAREGFAVAFNVGDYGLSEGLGLIVSMFKDAINAIWGIFIDYVTPLLESLKLG